MQMSMYDAMEKIKLAKMLMEKIDNDEPIETRVDDIYTLLNEYSEILLNAKVKIG